MPRPRSFAVHSSGEAIVAVDDRGVHLPVTDADFVTRRQRLPHRIKDRVGALLGWIGRLLYLSPLIWLASVFAPAPVDGYLLVGFVCTAVAFFAVLNVFVVTSVVAFKSGLRPLLELDPPHRHPAPASPRALPVPRAHEAPLAPGSIVTVTGRVVSLEAGAGQPVVVDLWDLEGTPVRLTEVHPFAVMAQDGMPVVVTSAFPPQIHAEPSRTRFGDAMMALSPETRSFFSRLPVGVVGGDETVERVMLRPGDDVRVTAVVIEVVEDVAAFVIDGHELGLKRDREAAPYREGERQRGVIVGATASEPLVIERL